MPLPDHGFKLAPHLHAGGTVFAAWSLLPSPLVVETIGRAGLSAIVIDCQHGMWDGTSSFEGICAAHLAGASPIVRIPVGDFAAANRALDIGAEAIIAPMINTEADARAFVAATKYPPVGARSWGAFRAMELLGIADARAYLDGANASTLTLAMIETTTALDNVEAIAATPGIDGLFVGPYDLSITLARGADMNPHAPAVTAALDRVLTAAAKAGKFAGLFCGSGADAAAAAKRGFRFLSMGIDSFMLRDGVLAQVAALAPA